MSDQTRPCIGPEMRSYSGAAILPRVLVFGADCGFLPLEARLLLIPNTWPPDVATCRTAIGLWSGFVVFGFTHLAALAGVHTPSLSDWLPQPLELDRRAGCQGRL
jgi:hypothetical protein